MLQIDFNHLKEIMPDDARRKVKRLEWLELLMSSVVKSYSNFKKDYNEYVFLAQHNHQVISLENLLNSKLLPSIPIKIIDGDWLDETYLGYQNELFLKPVYLYQESEASTTTYLYQESEFEDDVVDFYVLISTGDSALIPQINGWVEKYKAADKSYEIKTI